MKLAMLLTAAGIVLATLSSGIDVSVDASAPVRPSPQPAPSAMGVMPELSSLSAENLEVAMTQEVVVGGQKLVTEKGNGFSSTGHRDDEGRRQGTWEWLYKSGACVIAEYIDDKRHGLFVERFPSGSLRREVVYLNGVIHSSRSWFEDGTPSTDSTRNEDGPVGYEWVYNRDGSVASEAHFSLRQE